MVSLAIDPPPSPRQRSRRGLLAAIGCLLLAAALGAGFWLGRKTAPSGRIQDAASAAPPAAAPAQKGATSAPAKAATSSSALALPTAAASAEPAPAAGPRRLEVALNGSLEESIAAALPAAERAYAEELTAVVNRILMWDLQVARDGRRGDRVEVLWTLPSAVAAGLPVSAEPVVIALRYVSSKLGTVLAAYRYEPKGARWARYYRPDGSEVEWRLVDAPVTDYEQVTSLLRDGRRHKGVDFKTPVGSPVIAPFDGVVERRNWHFAANGNCLDLRDSSTGRHAIFLHLDVLPKEMQLGRKVHKGEVIASSGNTGHSFAPHVHYQLEDASGRVLDPFATLRTMRRTLPDSEKASFEAERAKLDAQLGS